MVMYMQQCKLRLPPYHYEELAFPGVKVDEIEIDTLITYVDIFDSDITNAVFMTAEEIETDTFQVRDTGCLTHTTLVLT